MVRIKSCGPAKRTPRSVRIRATELDPDSYWYRGVLYALIQRPDVFGKDREARLLVTDPLRDGWLNAKRGPFVGLYAATDLYLQEM